MSEPFWVQPRQSFAWVAIKMSYVFSAALVVVPISVVVIAIITFLDQRRQGKHRGVPREEFIAAFAETAASVEISATVYDYYKGQVISKEYSVAPDDDFEAVLSKGDEDIDDDAVFMIKKLGLKKPSGFSEARAEVRIKTLRDMVLWLEWIRQHQGS